MCLDMMALVSQTLEDINISINTTDHPTPTPSPITTEILRCFDIWCTGRMETWKKKKTKIKTKIKQDNTNLVGHNTWNTVSNRTKMSNNNYPNEWLQMVLHTHTHTLSHFEYMHVPSDQLYYTNNKNKTDQKAKPYWM